MAAWHRIPIVKRHPFLFCVLLCALAVAGCVPTAAPVNRPPREAPRPPSPLPATHAPAASAAAEPGVTLVYADNAQVELISPGGTRVLIDVYDPARLSRAATAQDALLTTHDRLDHLNAAFLASFPGRKLTYTPGTLELGDVLVRGVASARTAADAIDPQAPTNTIFIVDLGGLRFAHFGDIGQDALTPDQLAALADVDVAIAPLSNPESGMDYDNRKGFMLLQQVAPRLVVPTHNSMMAARYANDLWHCVYSPQSSVVVTRAKLAGDVHCLLLGSASATFQQMLKLPVVQW